MGGPTTRATSIHHEEGDENVKYGFCEMNKQNVYAKLVHGASASHIIPDAKDVLVFTDAKFRKECLDNQSRNWAVADIQKNAEVSFKYKSKKTRKKKKSQRHAQYQNYTYLLTLAKPIRLKNQGPGVRKTITVRKTTFLELSVARYKK